MAKDAVVSRLFDSCVDPISGQPESKATAVSIQACDFPQWAVLVSRIPIDCSGFAYWSKAALKDGYYYNVANDRKNFSWREWVEENIGEQDNLIQFSDNATLDERMIFMQGPQISMMVFAHSENSRLPGYSWLKSVFNRLIDSNINALVGSEVGETDAEICGCFEVSRKSILNAVENGQDSLEKLAGNLGCGSKCGSCRPEISELLQA